MEGFEVPRDVVCFAVTPLKLGREMQACSHFRRRRTASPFCAHHQGTEYGKGRKEEIAVCTPARQLVVQITRERVVGLAEHLSSL
jgi:hypothetical protein